MIGWRANEERSPVRRAGCLRGARPQGRFRTAQFQMANCRLQIAGAVRGDPVLRTAHRGVQAGSRNIAECRIKRRSPRKPRRGVCPLSWQSNGEIFAYVRLCSPMFAFLGKKCLRALREGKSRMIRAHPTKSDQIRPNPTKSNQIRRIISISHVWQRFTKARAVWEPESVGETPTGATETVALPVPWLGIRGRTVEWIWALGRH